MNPGDSQLADWQRGGHTVPGGLDDLGRRTHRITVFSPDFWDTEPVPMDAGELRRDAIAAASQAPRIPRVSKRQEAPMCVAGICRQGRARCARPELCSGHVDRDQSDSQSFPMARLDDLGHAVVLWLCVVVLCVMVPALVFRITWADALQLLAMIGGAR